MQQCFSMSLLLCVGMKGGSYIMKREWINSISTMILLALGVPVATPAEPAAQDNLPARCYSAQEGHQHPSHLYSTTDAKMGVVLADAPRISETIYVGGAVYTRTGGRKCTSSRASLRQVLHLRRPSGVAKPAMTGAQAHSKTMKNETESGRTICFAGIAVRN
jgi:hypothetical protein